MSARKSTMSIRFLVLAATLVFVASAVSAQTRQISLKSGERADVQAVYWVKNCSSTLKKITGVDILEGGTPDIQLSVREEMVKATRQNCPDKVPGGVVVVTASEVTEKKSVLLQYRVKYETNDGMQQSTHSVQIDLSP